MKIEAWIGTLEGPAINPTQSKEMMGATFLASRKLLTRPSPTFSPYPHPSHLGDIIHDTVDDIARRVSSLTMSSLLRLLTTGDGADVVVFCKGDLFFVHKEVIAAQSPVLEQEIINLQVVLPVIAWVHSILIQFRRPLMVKPACSTASPQTPFEMF